MRSKKKVPVKKKQNKPPIKKQKSVINSFISNYPKSLEGIKRMAVDLYAFLTPAQTKKDYLHAYNDAPVEKLLREKRIPVLFEFSKSGKLKPKWGCYTLCRTMFVSLKAMNLKPKMARYFLEGNGPLLVQRKITLSNGHRPHTSIFFEFQGKVYNIDPFFPRLPLHEVTKAELLEIERLSKMKKFFFVKPGQIPFEEFLQERDTGAIHPRQSKKAK